MAPSDPQPYSYDGPRYVTSTNTINTNPYLDSGAVVQSKFETPKELRKRAKKIEQERARMREVHKKARRELKRRKADRETVRKGLLAVMNSEKGYGKAEAARALNDLGLI